MFFMIVYGQLLKFNEEYYLVPEKLRELFHSFCLEIRDDGSTGCWARFYNRFDRYHIHNIHTKKFLMNSKET